MPRVAVAETRIVSPLPNLIPHSFVILDIMNLREDCILLAWLIMADELVISFFLLGLCSSTLFVFVYIEWIHVFEILLLGSVLCLRYA